MNSMLVDTVVVISVLFMTIVLFNPRMLASSIWRATVTPLASIIGSGFLVLGPLLIRGFGAGALYVMTALCLVAYSVGAAIRWNIKMIEGEGGRRAPSSQIPGRVLDTLSSWALAFAYIISVCYYLNLFGAFSVSLIEQNNPFYGRLITSAVLVFIGVLGWWRGLLGLEQAEELAVAVKLAVITGLLVGMVYYTGDLANQGTLHHNGAHFDWQSIRIAFGLLITVQGFETSRYLKEEYDVGTRISTMRYAQWISTAIYLIYIGLAAMDFSAESIGDSETAIIQMTAQVAPILPLFLIVAALASQFSAAVADTNGSGGLAEELSRGKVKSRLAYLVLVIMCVAITWLADIYQIISYASRAFAVYYSLQCALATSISYRIKGISARTVGYGGLALFLLAVAVLGIPAE